MGLIAEEIRELRQMPKQLSAGVITIDEVRAKLNIYKEVHKRARLMLDIYIACGRPHLIEGRLHSLNLISKGEMVQSDSNIELEMVKCSMQDGRAITREGCLSFSGEEKNIEDCRGCENFKITRRLLIKE